MVSLSSHYLCISPSLFFSYSFSASLTPSVTLNHFVLLVLFAYRMLSLSCNPPLPLSFLFTTFLLLPSLFLLHFRCILLICCIGLCLCLCLRQLNDVAYSVSFLLCVCQSRCHNEYLSNLFSCTLHHHNVYNLRWWYILRLYNFRYRMWYYYTCTLHCCMIWYTII